MNDAALQALSRRCDALCLDPESAYFGDELENLRGILRGVIDHLARSPAAAPVTRPPAAAPVTRPPAATSSHSAYPLRGPGYSVYRLNRPVSGTVCMHVEFRARRATPIFNGPHGNDDRRRQAALGCVAAARSLAALVSEAIGRRVRPEDGVVLISDAGCTAQTCHTDYDGDQVAEVRRAHGPDAVPVSVLLAIEPGTRLRIWPVDSAALSDPAPVELALAPGDVVVFDGDLPHADAAYDARNVRVHFYIDGRYARREPDRTYILLDSDN